MRPSILSNNVPSVSRFGLDCIALIATSLLLAGCGSNSSAGAHCSPSGGPVDGGVDDHCSGVPVIAVDPSVCTSSSAAGEADAGAEEAASVLYNTEGYDDDCKYHVTWSASSICENSDVTLQVHLTKKSDGTGVSGATPWAEVFLGDESHSSPFGNQSYREGANGMYTIGPIRFDQAGHWTLKFHFFPDSCDAPASPHGHVAFYVNVP